MGSTFLGDCVQDRVHGDEECNMLGNRIAEHINGNALYRVSTDTARFVNAAASHPGTKGWPFDLAMHLYLREVMDEPKRRR